MTTRKFTDKIFILFKVLLTVETTKHNGRTLKDTPWKKSYDKTRQHIKKQRHYLSNKCPYNQSYGLTSSFILVQQLDHKRRLSAEELMLSNCGAGEDS